jgi:polyphosphate kinase
VASPPLLDPERSLVAFQWRVLAMAEDPAVPLLERLRFLGIVTGNLDELYMVHMAELRRAAAADPAQRERVAAIEDDVAALVAAQSRCAEACLRDAAAAGVTLVPWAALTPAERDALAARYRAEIQPDLQPHAITLSPGHPVPHLPHLGLFVAIVAREAPGARLRIFEHELPRDVPRLWPVPGRPGAVIALEEVLRTQAHRLHPEALVEGIHLFRVTRGGDLPLDEADAADPLQAVARATERRPFNPIVRVEVERSTPTGIAVRILAGLRHDTATGERGATVDAVQVVDGMLDLRGLATLPLGAAHAWPALPTLAPVPAGASLFDAIRAGDLLAHHPFDGFDETVARFVADAARDPAVEAIAITLYRVGQPSPIVEALLGAAAAGKRVFACVELQARFDEAHNVHWARALERAGGVVTYGLPGLKVHAKVALVTRREGGTVVRYVHVGSGNYNPRSGRQYTDLSLFSARAPLADDVAALFDALAGGEPPAPMRHGGLVAPAQLLPALRERIAREAAHARAGRPAGITIKVNALADTEMATALCEAAAAGVAVDLVVRGICTLRPGVPGASDGVRVVSVVGRFLEHSRVFRFANGGEPEHLIGSSDLRPRNLRRRVELLVPVVEPAHRAMLDDLLARYLADPTGWRLGPDGRYRRQGGAGHGAQAWYAGADGADGALRPPAAHP